MRRAGLAVPAGVKTFARSPPPSLDRKNQITFKCYIFLPKLFDKKE